MRPPTRAGSRPHSSATASKRGSRGRGALGSLVLFFRGCRRGCGALVEEASPWGLVDEFSMGAPGAPLECARRTVDGAPGALYGAPGALLGSGEWCAARTVLGNR